MNIAFLKARQTKYAAYAATYIAVIVGILIAANVLASRYDKSFDATANKRYSLSDQTKKIIKGLKQDATITYFDRPRGFQSAKDQLDLYSNLSPRVHVKYVDPDKEPLVAREAGVKSTGTAIVEVGLNKNEAKSVTEEEITGALIRDVKNNTRTVCFVTGTGEHRIDDSESSGLSHFKDLLAKDNYTAKPIGLLQKAEVPGDCTVLAVAGPHEDYQQPEVDAIRKYVEDGGRALFLLDPPLKVGRSQIADNETLAGLLQSWGVTLEKDLVLDLNPIGQLMGLGPQVALVFNYDTHAIVREMQGLATGFPMTRSLEAKNGAKTTVEKLFSSSESSLATDKLNSPRINAGDPKNKKGPMTIAAAGTYSTGKDNSQGRFVVVGSSDWASNGFIGFKGNRDLAMNTINWLASDEDLISIRPKDPEERRVTLTTAQFQWVRLSSQFILPLVVIFAGISVWWRRR